MGDTFTKDQLKYTVLTEEEATGTAAVSGYSDELEVVTIPDSVSNNAKTYSVTALGEDAFSWCDSLKILTIPASVTSIAKNAFGACFDLERVYYEGDVPETQSGLYDAAPDTLISYYKATNKTSWELVIVDGKWQDRSIVIRFTEGLQYQYNDDGTASVAGIGSATDADIFIPSSVINEGKIYAVISIDDRAFIKCSNLTSVMIPDSVTSIGCGAFFNCKNLNNINVDLNNPTYSSLEGVLFDKEQRILMQYPLAREGEYTIPESVESIGYYAFAGCTGATSLIIPEGMKSIENNVFYKFKGLQKIQLPSTLKMIDEDAFFGCVNLQEIIIPDSVTNIGAGAFANCRNLELLDLPNYVKEIGDSAFYRCEKLKFAYIPDSCVKIGGYMFNYCHSLEKVIVGAGIGEIQDGFFLNCSNLREIYFLGDNPGLNCDMFFVHDYFKILNRSYSVSDISPEFYFKAIQDNTPTIYFLQDRCGWNPSDYEEVLEIIRNSSSQHGLNNPKIAIRKQGKARNREQEKELERG